jgi:hypothetical protein
MKWLMIAAVAALAQLVAASPAAAQWSSVRGTTSDTKISQCIMSSTQGGQELRLIKFGDDARYYVHLVSGQMRFSDTVRHTVPATFDNGRTWRLNAVGARGDGGLLAGMSAGDFHAFLTDLRTGNRVRFDLGAVGYPDWVMSLAGSSAAADVFLRCVPQLT